MDQTTKAVFVVGTEAEESQEISELIFKHLGFDVHIRYQNLNLDDDESLLRYLKSRQASEYVYVIATPPPRAVTVLKARDVHINFFLLEYIRGKWETHEISWRSIKHVQFPQRKVMTANHPPDYFG